MNFCLDLKSITAVGPSENVSYSSPIMTRNKYLGGKANHANAAVNSLSLKRQSSDRSKSVLARKIRRPRRITWK